MFQLLLSDHTFLVFKTTPHTHPKTADNTLKYRIALMACSHNFCGHSYFFIFQEEIKSRCVQYKVWEDVLIDLEKDFCISLNRFFALNLLSFSVSFTSTCPASPSCLNFLCSQTFSYCPQCPKYISSLFYLPLTLSYLSGLVFVVFSPM